nr:E3 ubiquitin-protein ligase RNF126-A [Ipomoea batatas]
MAMAVSDTSTVGAERSNRYRRPRNPKQNLPSADTDPNPEGVNSTRSKSTISAILLAPFSPTSPTHDSPTTKKKNFATFRGLGCAAPPQVSVPAVIRTSADWDSKKVKKKKARSKKSKPVNCAVVPGINGNSNGSNGSSSSCVAVPDVWCGPGIGLTTDAASVDCVVSRRPVNGRGRVDSDNKLPSRERSGYTVRRMVIPEDNPFLEIDSALELPRSRVDHFVSRHHRPSRYGFPEGLAEIVMLQNSLMGGRSDGLDRYRDLRLDVDSMSYEELLELGDRIGYVNTGLREDEIARCVQKTELPFLTNLRSHVPTEMEKKCSVCQEEYEADDEMGKLECGHLYHIDCIKEWLLQKNACPICKSAARSHSNV